MRWRYLYACIVAMTAACHTGPHTVEVYRSDEARQCEGEGISLEAMRLRLQGVTVYAARKDHVYTDVYPEVCGAPMSSVNVYTINRVDWPQARARGFERFPVSD